MEASKAFKIYGLDCAEEVATIKRELGPRFGEHSLSFDVLNAKMLVSGANVTSTEIILAIERTGMRAETWENFLQSNAKKNNFFEKWSRSGLTVLSGLLLAAGFVTDVFQRGVAGALMEGANHDMHFVVRAIYLAATLSGVWFVVPKAFRALMRLRPDMNLLMTVAVLGAIGIGEYIEAAAVAFLFALSLALEAWSVGRARRAVAALMALTPEKARVKDERQRSESLVDVAKVAVGSIIIVKPGEKFPLDGIVKVGTTSVNQAPITGESIPVEKVPGSEVYAGTINEDGAVEVVTTKVASDTTLAKIVKMVGEAQSKRAPSEQWVETFARYYTPAVMILALAIFIFPPLVMGQPWAKWFYEALVLLVIACPCALVISTPVSIVAALAAAARNGVLIKGGLFVELPSKLQAIALDKTGTLTEGKPKVNKLVALSGHTEDELMAIASAIEQRSEHPLGRAMINYARERGIVAQPVEEFQAIQGKGATAKLQGKSVWIGSHKYLEERGEESFEMHQRLETLSETGSSVVVVGEEGHVCGFIAISDTVRSSAKQTISDLKSLGIEQIVMLTGDNRPTAMAVALQTGISDVRAELLPEDKIKAVEELSHRYLHVAMVGDGVNDAPAMARASIGIAMGAVGTDAALETADIALMSDDLSKLPWLIHHSRRAGRIIKQNISASLGVKAMFVVLTLLGHSSLWAAIAADMGMSLLVVFNALRLLKI